MDEQVLAFASLCSKLGSIEKMRQSVPRSRKKEKSGEMILYSVEGEGWMENRDLGKEKYRGGAKIAEKIVERGNKRG